MDKDKHRMHEIGIAIARERVRQGLTQEELAHMIGNADHTYLSRVECGRKLPSLRMMFNLADVLNVDVHYFFSKI